ncbi:MAG: hypothetical protein M1814_002516 [Vezdaea aestivalis]|nr:MAG: hypothetical protein M1814_002516 [Vezdaea aestivalis]
MSTNTASGSSNGFCKLCNETRNWFDEEFRLYRGDKGLWHWGTDIQGFAYSSDSVLERYSRTGKILGTGLRTTVLEVSDKLDGKTYAMKEIRCTAQDFAQRKTDLRNEIQIMYHLSHIHNVEEVLVTGKSTQDVPTEEERTKSSSNPKITRLIRAHSEEEKRMLYLIMWPVADKSLRDYMLDKYGSQETEDIYFFSMFEDLADGLSSIHKSSVRHKDVKPDNVLLYNGGLMYADFGISSFTKTESGTTEGPGTSFTPTYAAPEVLDCNPRNKKSDIFSLGAVFYEILGHVARIVELQDTCFGSDQFKGYAKMAKNGTISQKIKLAREAHLIAEKHEPIFATALLDCLNLTEKMLAVQECDRPYAMEVVQDLQRTRTKLKPRVFSTPNRSTQAVTSTWKRVKDPFGNAMFVDGLDGDLTWINMDAT